MIKTRLHDPQSFEHDTTRYMTLPNGNIQVFMTYRGKNAFGAVVRESVTAEFDLSGNFIRFVE